LYFLEFQTVSFCDVFLRVSTAKAKTILIIVPINTIQNWVNEFNMWLPTSGSKNSSASTTSTKPRKRRGNKNGKSFPNGDTNTVPQPTTAPANQTTLPSEAQASSSVISNELNDSVSETVSLNLTFDSTLNLSEMLNNEDSSESRKQSGDDTSKEQPEVELEETPEAEVNSRGFEVFILNETVKTLQAREKVITQWSTNGGVLLIGYEMYRMLALKKLKKSTKKQPQQSFFSNYGMDVGETESLNRIHTCLVNPGPDLVICDEGHRIKNSGASISNALKAIKTRRRVVLTGYPLQNNLMEYWCMVDFIRPNYLGSKVEFSNMFERPISNGQCVDSTFEDRRLMRYRSHVLHSLLEGFVQRRSHAVLQTALPEKQEWVFLLKMTPVQYNLYKEFIKYLSENVEGQSAANPIKAFAVCCKIWNHPDALYNVVKKKQSILDDLDLDEVTAAADGSNSKPKGRGGNKKKDPQTGQDQIAYFDGSGFNFPRSHYGSYSTNTSSSGRSDQSLSLDWAMPIFQNYEPGVLENGVKFEILFEIIKESVACNDKLLVFSQSLLSLDLIETFLSQKFKWLKNEQYYRLDGSTTGLEREKLVNKFNAKPEVFVFLVSTRAGSLGINLTGANRVVVLDASWNPCHDCQAVCRIYR
jgi:RAD54-like protein 2